MEAHNGLSARIAEESGFEGIWASSLTMAASLGLRDCNEASWTQILDILEYMSDACQRPILMDGDTGYGNFNNVRRLVKKLGTRGVAGVCIEDKGFPKTNSLLDNSPTALADTEEFCGRIRAAKDHQPNAQFAVVARTEAFICGQTVAEALHRAYAYRDAGADAILVHSRRETADDIGEFMQEWDKSRPILIAPTTYYKTPTSQFLAWGISTVIWANHSLRSAIHAMQETCRQLVREQYAAQVCARVAPVSEIFRLQGMEELQAAEKRYLPPLRRLSSV
jgi:phosphoenolpyruvate phosphomutase